ncbi:MAG: metallophosphoesterase [Azospirillum sp.]|nr:metallophosphoesterase [Azospirillum sp.]
MENHRTTARTASPSIEVSDAAFAAVYAIGDVHGNAEMALAAHEEIRRRISDSGFGTREKPVLVLHLGDIFDRGFGGLKILDAILDWREEAVKAPGVHVECLMGNHEQMMRAALFDDDADMRAYGAVNWIRNGGGHVLAELFDTRSERDPRMIEAANGLACGDGRIAASIRGAIGGRRMSMLRDGLLSHVRVGNRLYVHAGVDWLKPADEFFGRKPDFSDDPSLDEHWCWIRYPFLSREPGDAIHPDWEDVFVIHGHSIERTPDMLPRILPWRLNLDGGSYGRNPRVHAAELTPDRVSTLTIAEGFERCWTNRDAPGNRQNPQMMRP